MSVIFEKSVSGRRGYGIPRSDVPEASLEEYAPYLRKEKAGLPEVSEPDCMRHYIGLSNLNHHVDKGFYPLGSCTMKYNPKINEDVARLPGFTGLHPFQGDKSSQGALALMWELQEYLKEISGLSGMTLQPAAGAHGELTGLLMIRAWHEHRDNPRKYVLIPDSAHGTNPASVVLAGYKVRKLPSDQRGLIDYAALKEALDENTAALMITNPNTLGLFEVDIEEITRIVHEAGALMYMDGANLNALLGWSKPGDAGFDVVHFNLHKTFSTPHGGGGPGAGPVGVSESLIPFLPSPRIVREDGCFRFKKDYPLSIGRMHSFYGNFGVLIKAFAYIRMLGADGLAEVSKMAIINANYLRNLLVEDFELPYGNVPCMHEFVLEGPDGKNTEGVRTADIAKRLLDYGFHAPTVYFPLIVPEALMIEPTETEDMATLDRFAETMKGILAEASENPELVKNAPHNTPVKRMDELSAARKPVLRWSGVKRES